MAKAVLKLGTTRGLIERLTMDRPLKRICGFPMYKPLPDEATFSRAFSEFTAKKLAERVHEARIKDEFGGRSIWVRGGEKVMSHLMFGIWALTADAWMRVFT